MKLFLMFFPIVLMLSACSKSTNSDNHFFPTTDRDRDGLKKEVSYFIEYQSRGKNGEKFKVAERRFDENGFLMYSENRESNHKLPYPIVKSIVFDRVAVREDSMEIHIYRQIAPDADFAKLTSQTAEVPIMKDTSYGAELRNEFGHVVIRKSGPSVNDIRQIDQYEFDYNGSRVQAITVISIPVLDTAAEYGWTKTSFERNQNGDVKRISGKALGESIVDTINFSQELQYFQDSIVQVSKREDGQVFSKVIFDPYFNKINEYRNGISILPGEISYEYDENGNWITKFSIFDNQRSGSTDTLITTRKIEYY